MSVLRCVLIVSGVLLLPPSLASASAPPHAALYLEARTAQMAGDLETAVPKLLDAIHHEGPLQAFAAQALAEAANALGDADLRLCALDSWVRTERLRTMRVKAHRALGEHLADLGLPEDAVPALQVWVNAPKDARDRSRARWALARAYRDAGQADEANGLLRQIVHDDPTSVQARDAVALLPDPTDLRGRYDVGYVHLKHQRWAAAEHWLGALAAERLPARFEPQVLYAWAEAQSRTASRAEGRRAHAQLAWGYPRSGYARKALQRIASLFSREHRYTDALAAYDEVVDHAPRHDAAVQALWDGAKLLRRRDAAAAAERLARLQREYPNHLLADDALRAQGIVLYSAGRFADAAEAFRRAYTRYPRRRTADDSAYWEGKCALALHDTTAAREAFERVIREWPADFYAYRAAEQLAALADQHTEDLLLTVLSNDAVFGFALHDLSSDDAPIAFTGEEAFTGKGEQHADLLTWFITNDLPEARHLIAELRPLAETRAQRFALARASACAGDYETSVLLADGLTRAAPDAKAAAAYTRYRFPEAWVEHVRPHAVAYGVDHYLSLAVMREESHFRAAIDSSAGARGVMQIMPRTGQWLGKRVPEAGPYSHDRLYQVPYNIQLGTYYLGHLLEQFNGNVVLAVAGYNGGPGNVRRWVNTYGLDDIDLFIEMIPYDETSEYVKKVLGSYGTYHRLAWRKLGADRG